MGCRSPSEKGNTCPGFLVILSRALCDPNAARNSNRRLLPGYALQTLEIMIMRVRFFGLSSVVLGGVLGSILSQSSIALADPVPSAAVNSQGGGISVNNTQIHHPRLCSSPGHRSQKIVLGTPLPVANPSGFLLFQPNYLQGARIAQISRKRLLP